MPHIDLLELPIFAGIGLTDLVSLVDAMPPRQFAPGSCLISEGDPTLPPLYVITKGEVVITQRKIIEPGACGTDPPPADVVLARLVAPTLVGEVELFCQSPARATARAHTQVSSFLLERSTFAAMEERRHPALLPFVLQVARVACERLGASGLAQVQDSRLNPRSP